MADRKVRLDRESVLAGAESLAAREGLEGVTMRGLAHHLGVTPMALYRHVEGIADLTNALVERAIAETPVPDLADDADWPAALAWLGHTHLALLGAHPLALAAFLRQPVTTPRLRSLAEPVLARLRASGFGRDAAVAAYRSVLALTVGYAALRQKWRAQHATAVPEHVSAVIHDAGASEGLPTLADLAPGLAAPYPEEHYAVALGALIAGLQPW